MQCTALQNNSVLADEFEITPAWDDDITAISTEEETYRVGGLNFHRSEVLNHRLEAPIRFPHIGYRIEGWLFAQGIRPVPAEYGARHPAPLELNLWDQKGRIYSAHSVASVDRSAQSNELRAGVKPARVAAFLERELGGSHDFSAGRFLPHGEITERPYVRSEREAKLQRAEKQTDVEFYQGGIWINGTTYSAWA